MHDIEKMITDEKYNLELKEKVNFKDPKSYLKTVSSFANGNDNGYIIFGIEDETKKIVGIDDVKKSYEEIAERIKTRIDPSIVPIIDIVKVKDKNIIIVKVIPGQNTPYYYVNKGTRIAYIRKGDQDCEANSIELNELILRGKNIGWDEQVTDNNYEDFTFKHLKEYFKEIKGYDIDKNSLQSFDLIKDDKLTNAALLYSDQNPVVGSFVACVRWNGLEKISAKDDIEYYGSILDQIDNAMEFVKKHMSNGWVKEGNLARRTIPEYDLNSIREALINAEGHRQYLMRGTNIELDFYDDRIEIVSFGGLDYGRTIEEVLNIPASKRRNPLVCDIFSRLDFMERRGSGIRKMMEAYENDEKKPKFEVKYDAFVVTFYSRLYKNAGVNEENAGVNEENAGVNEENAGVNEINILEEKYHKLNRTKIEILKLIIKDNKITQEEISKRLRKTESTIYRNIKDLKRLNIIERIGSDKKGYWKIKL